MAYIMRHLSIIAVVMVVVIFVISIVVQSPAITATALFASWPAVYWLGWANHTAKLRREAEIEERVLRKMGATLRKAS